MQGYETQVKLPITWALHFISCHFWRTCFCLHRKTEKQHYAKNTNNLGLLGQTVNEQNLKVEHFRSITDILRNQIFWLIFSHLEWLANCRTVEWQYNNTGSVWLCYLCPQEPDTDLPTTPLLKLTFSPIMSLSDFTHTPRDFCVFSFAFRIKASQVACHHW